MLIFVFFSFAAASLAGENNSWALLEVDALLPDRYIGELLSRAEMENYISESTQWVFLNDFGELNRIPLDEFPDRLEDFDPRHDGYAERLSAFFVPGETRRFFIPLSPVFSGSGRAKFEKNIAGSLGDIPHSLSFFGKPRSLLGPLVIFVIASAFFIALGIFIKKSLKKPGVRRAGSLTHVRFVPVQILDQGPSFAVPWLAFPLTLAFVLSLLVFFLFPLQSGKTNWPGEFLVGAEEYARHAAFQVSFPRRPLSGAEAEGGLNQPEYLRYYLGDDGLIAGTEDFSAPDDGLIAGTAEIPPFPLKDLMEFLAGEGLPEKELPPLRYLFIPAALLTLALCSAFFRGGKIRYKKMKVFMMNDKRAAA